MNYPATRHTVAMGAVSAIVAAAALSPAPASAATNRTGGGSSSEPPASAVLTQIRADLRATGTAAEVTTFDQLSAEQRDRLTSYFLDLDADSTIIAGSTEAVSGSTVMRTNGDFAWGQTNQAGGESSDGTADLAAASRTSWGTQWFAFAGIKLSETKVSISYEYSGTTAKKLLGYSCTVVRNVQPFTDVKTSKSSGYISGGQATGKCKVVAKRGVPTPWGSVAWSTHSAIQRLSAKGNGAITANRWE